MLTEHPTNEPSGFLVHPFNPYDQDRRGADATCPAAASPYFALSGPPNSLARVAGGDALSGNPPGGDQDAPTRAFAGVIRRREGGSPLAPDDEPERITHQQPWTLCRFCVICNTGFFRDRKAAVSFTLADERN